MKTIGKVVLIASIALFATVAQSGCVSSVNPDTGEKDWRFAPTEAVKNAVAVVKEMPDDVKASVFEGLGWLLGSLGVGAAAVPVCSSAASYFRNRAKNKELAAEAEKAKESLRKITDATTPTV